MRRMISISLALILTITLVPARDIQDDLDEGTPFGKTTARAVRQLYSFGKAHGVDIEAEYERAEKGEGEGLEHIFALSTHFKSLNTPARMYGNLIYASFLNLVEERGEAYFADALDSQSQDVRQRVRDFLCYPFTLLPKEEGDAQLKDAREEFPRILPHSYVYAQDDPLFGRTSNYGMNPPASGRLVPRATRQRSPAAGYAGR